VDYPIGDRDAILDWQTVTRSKAAKTSDDRFFIREAESAQGPLSNAAMQQAGQVVTAPDDPESGGFYGVGIGTR
jgi:hypothetical protein